MADTPADSPSPDQVAREDADLEAVRQAAKAGYQGHPFPPTRVLPSVRKRDERRAERERETAKLNYRGLPQRPIMQFTARKTSAVLAKPSTERSLHVDLKFTQTGKYLIAAGSHQPDGQTSFKPVLYISLVGDKGWATHYPLQGKFAKDEDAAAAALSYGIRIVTRQVRDAPLPGDPAPLAGV